MIIRTTDIVSRKVKTSSRPRPRPVTISGAKFGK